MIIGYVVEMLMTQIETAYCLLEEEKRMITIKIILLLLTCFADLGISIRLIYPPERFPFFDFAPLSDISSSCDFSHFEKDFVTDVEAGSPLTITWVGDGNHVENITFELVDHDHQTTYTFDTFNARTKEQHGVLLHIVELFIPKSVTCISCFLRISGYTKNQKFQSSCSDVQVKKCRNLPSADVQPCSSHGKLIDGSCRCDRLHYGQYCQFRDDCWDDDDCGGNGQCIRLEKSVFPKRLCFCNVGWFGSRCNLQSSDAKLSMKNPNLYRERTFAKDSKFYWRILEEQNEIEMVIRYPGRSWIAVGWKPDDEIEPCPPEVNHYEEFKIVDESGLIKSGNVVPIEGKMASSNVDAVSVESRRNLDSFPEKILETELPKLVTAGPSPNNFITDMTISVELPLETNAFQSTTISNEHCYGEMHWPSACTNDCTYRASWSYAEESDLIEFSIEAKLTPNSWTGIGFSSEQRAVQSCLGLDDDNVDMIMVKSVEGSLTVHDMHGRLEELVPDPAQNVIVAGELGSHEDGILRASFSRPRTTSDFLNDVQFTDTECFYMVFPVEGGKLDRDGSISQLASVIKFSGKKVCVKSCLAMTNHKNCQTEYKYPSDCTNNECEYMAKWKYNSDDDSVTFQISSKNLDRWTGIGFSRTGSMLNSDIVMGWVHDGMGVVTDRFAYGKHQPAIDKEQDIYDVEGRIDGDVQTITFTRNRTTTDYREDLPLTECLYFLFPVGGGSINAANDVDRLNPSTAIGYHDKLSPQISSEPICICTGPPSSSSRHKRQDTQAPMYLGCSDVIIGSVINDRCHIKAVVKGLQNETRTDQIIRSAVGYENDAQTTIIVRRRLNFPGNAMAPVRDERVTLLWAKGTIKSAATDTDVNNMDSASLYKHHELYQPNTYQSGIMSINFFEKPSHDQQSICGGQFAYPKACGETEPCKYEVQWERTGPNVQFTFKVKIARNHWTGIGFSENGKMAGSDAVIISALDDGKIEITDRFISDYSEPTVDENQNIFDIDYTYNNGILKAHFFRALTTDDMSKDISLEKCVYFLYPYDGGEINDDGTMEMHRSVPERSATQICLGHCHSDGTVIEKKQPDFNAPLSTSKQIRHRLRFTVLNHNFTQEMIGKNEQQNRQLLLHLEQAIASVFRKKFDNIDVHLSSLSSDSKVDMILTSDEDLTTDQLYDTILPAARSGPIENFQIDQNSVEIATLDQSPTAEEIRNYIIIAVVSLIVLAAIIFTIYILWRMRRRKKKVMYPPQMSAENAKHYVNYSYAPTYPMGAPLYPYYHHYQYSNTSTVTAHDKTPTPPRPTTARTDGFGAMAAEQNKPKNTTTYGEWRNRIYGNRAVDGALQAGPPNNTRYQHNDSKSKPYVTYPNDPHNYYTLNGTSRLSRGPGSSVPCQGR
ncbi:Teneurin-a [Trichinella pseudospiralis]|uniref:Cytochrome c oxidase polypeptide II n=1 Tax=Trichinella pseudospiralis TaxID=6337 RepID=A0A0V0XZL3_TRIPS|nr:Teneurin-a [Trichinella pseudospiralis]